MNDQFLEQWMNTKFCVKLGKQWEKDMRFSTWNIRSLCRIGAIKSVVGELEKLDLVGVKEVRWEE